MLPCRESRTRWRIKVTLTLVPTSAEPALTGSQPGPLWAVIKSFSPGWVAQLVGSSSLYTKRLQVRPTVRAHTKVVGLIPGWGVYERQPIDVSHTHVCLSLSLSKSNCFLFSRKDFKN